MRHLFVKIIPVCLLTFACTAKRGQMVTNTSTTQRDSTTQTENLHLLDNLTTDQEISQSVQISADSVQIITRPDGSRTLTWYHPTKTQTTDNKTKTENKSTLEGVRSMSASHQGTTQDQTDLKTLQRPSAGITLWPLAIITTAGAILTLLIIYHKKTH